MHPIAQPSAAALVAALVATPLLNAQQPADAQHPNDHAVVDCSAVDRTPPQLPADCDNARYGRFVFGRDGKTLVWAVLAGGAPDGAPDRLYLDLDADGDLTDAGERFAGEATKGKVEFALGDLRIAGDDAVHTAAKITWTAGSVRFRMLWRGSKVTFGGYGPSHDTYAGFAATPAAAPIYVPGWDRPFRFERWIADPLPRGQSRDFKVFVGNRGDRTGTFAAVDDEFLPAGEYAVATLRYVDTEGRPQQAEFDLRERC